MTVEKHDCILKNIGFEIMGIELFGPLRFQRVLNPETTATRLTKIEFLDPN